MMQMGFPGIMNSAETFPIAGVTKKVVEREFMKQLLLQGKKRKVFS
jgi:hypothetical protein